MLSWGLFICRLPNPLFCANLILDKSFSLVIRLPIKKGGRMFSQDEKVVYPGHGVAIIQRILERRVGGKATKFYELKFINKDMTILVPVDNIESIGIRVLSTQKDIGKLLELFEDPIIPHANEMALNWNKRNKEYQGKIRSGNLQEICEIYRDLRHIEHQKELSFGEKALLQQAETLLAEEIALACDIGSEKATNQLRTLVQKEWQQ